jgi:hypothetical protein
VTKEKSLKGTGDGSEALAIEVGIFKGLKFSSTALIIIPTIMLVLSLVIVAASIIYCVGRQRKRQDRLHGCFRQAVIDQGG